LRDRAGKFKASCRWVNRDGASRPLVELPGAARSEALGADDLAQVAEAAMSGRVATLLIQAERWRALSPMFSHGLVGLLIW
jgi:hypothetical protein